MKLTSIAISTFALAMMAGSGAAMAQYIAAPQRTYLQAQYVAQYGFRDRDDRDDDGDGRQYARFRDRGFHDGFLGARRDFENHREFTPMNRDEYRHPDDVPREAIRAYRIAFREGYQRGVHEIREGEVR